MRRGCPREDAYGENAQNRKCEGAAEGGFQDSDEYGAGECSHAEHNAESPWDFAPVGLRETERPSAGL